MEKKRTPSRLSIMLKESQMNEKKITGNNVVPVENKEEMAEAVELDNSKLSHEVEEEVTLQPEAKTEQLIQEKPKKVTPVLPSEISLSTFLADRKKGDVVDKILIPRYQRDNLKVLSAIYNISMQDLAANVLDFFLDNYGQDVLKKLKKK